MDGASEVQPLRAVWQSLGRVAPDTCYVILVDISDRTGSDLLERPTVHDVLCREERARLDAFKRQELSWEYAASHAALRIVLGRCLGLPAADVVFRRPGEAFVPPEPVDAGGRGWRVSLSHSVPFAVIGLAIDSAVGVDVEPTSHGEVALESVGQFLCMEEIGLLTKMPAEDRADLALRAWCLKEAALKALGTGFETDPKSIRLNVNPTVTKQRVFVPAGSQTALSLHVLRNTAVAAVVGLAIERESASVLFSYASLNTILQFGAS